MPPPADTEAFPGADLVERGLDDLKRGRHTSHAMLVAMAAPRLRFCGLEVPEAGVTRPSHELYDLLAKDDPAGAHSRFNALAARIVSYARAAERARASADSDTTVYLTGGATAVMEGWRTSTVDVDLRIEPESDELFRALAAAKEALDLNIELASPPDFIPELPGWRERSPFVLQVERLTVRHFDPYSQALSKIERGFAQDLEDVAAMVSRGLVEPARARELFAAIEEEDFYRYPAIDPDGFEERVEAALPG